MRIVSIEASPLEVPLHEPFVIATGRMEATRAVLIRVTVESAHGVLTGLGEAACLPPVTAEDMPDVLAAATAIRVADVAIASSSDAADFAREAAGGRPVLGAAIECALVDALARADGVSARTWLGGASDGPLVSDVTIPIASVADMLRLAGEWRARGFTCFKIKVGVDDQHDARAILAIHHGVPGASFRLDANGGFTAAAALALVRELTTADVRVECFEQPCAREDWEGMRTVVAGTDIPVIADESLRSMADLPRIHQTGARGVNLKIVKLGGIIASLAIGREARRLGMQLMVGGMVETRLGMTCAATLAATLGDVEYCDLDTAWLLAGDPFEGGFVAEGPRMQLVPGLGFGVRWTG